MSARRRIRILIVDDVELHRDRLRLSLERLGILSSADLREADSSWKALHECQGFSPDVVFLDLKLDPGDNTGESGMKLLRQLRQMESQPDVVVVTGLDDEVNLWDPRKDGAIRNVAKPITEDKIAWAIKSTLERVQSELPRQALSPPLPKGVAEEIRRVAPFDIPVLIHGQTGVGKELVAEEIHRLSPRAKGPLVVFDCGAVPHELIESSLFGHLRGSFTGAIADRKGAFAEAQGGTIFLDEIGELAIELQPSLLRVLDRGEIRRVGANAYEKVDVRVIAATHRDLQDEVAHKTFRADLYYRLAHRLIKVPPLCERLDDLDWIVPHLLQRMEESLKVKVFSFSSQAMEKLKSFSWPGNVRELASVLESALVDAGSGSGMGQQGIRILGEHIRLPRAPARNDADLAEGLSRYLSLDENYQVLKRNLVRVLDADGMPAARVCASMKISKAEYYRIKAASREMNSGS